MQAQLVDIQGKEVGKIELQDKIFGAKPVSSFLHEFVTIYETNQRSGTAHTKVRSEVAGGGKKPWKQKHTGRARAGSNRSPLWRHGGITFGPRHKGKPRRDLPRQKAKLALAQALAVRLADGGIVFVDKFPIEAPKTKNVAAALNQLGAVGRVLIVIDQPDRNLTRASRNIPGLEILLASDLNAYVVLRAKKLVVTQPALEKLGARWN